MSKKLQEMENIICKINLKQLTKELEFVEMLFEEYSDDCFVGKTESYYVLFLDDVAIAFIDIETGTKFDVLVLAESLFAFSHYFKIRHNYFRRMISAFFREYSSSNRLLKYKPIK